jgi:hydrogenase maturation protein HypF
MSSTRVLALGAWLKNRACQVDFTPSPSGGGQGWGPAAAPSATATGPHPCLPPKGEGASPPCKNLKQEKFQVHWSALHGDLRDAAVCAALEKSARDLVAQHGQPAAVAHDLHPDFFSTRLAVALAHEWGVPAVAVQHHHAHIAGVMAEHGLDGPVIGLALDGVGLGTDGKAWGGELLKVSRDGFERLGHFWPLALPGGDAAAREPWRVLAAALHAMGRGGEIVERLGPQAGEASARMIQTMLARNLQCPETTSAGRWFDAASAALGLAPRQQAEAEAAVALEAAAASCPQAAPEGRATADLRADGVLDLRPLIAELLAWAPQDAPRAAAWFHRQLAAALADWAARAAHEHGSKTICLSGGCFFNKLLSSDVERLLSSHGLRVTRPETHSCGDNGLALGQAWVAAQQLAA